MVKTVVGGTGCRTEETRLGKKSKVGDTCSERV